MSMEHEIHERMRKSRSMKGRERDGMDDLTGKYKPGLVVGGLNVLSFLFWVCLLVWLLVR